MCEDPVTTVDLGRATAVVGASWWEGVGGEREADNGSCKIPPLGCCAVVADRKAPASSFSLFLTVSIIHSFGFNMLMVSNANWFPLNLFLVSVKTNGLRIYKQVSSVVRKKSLREVVIVMNIERNNFVLKSKEDLSGVYAREAKTSTKWPLYVECCVKSGE
ncbi:hypothetical protein RYX36_026375 [Vicia faba]